MATTVQSFPPGTTIKIVPRTHANDRPDAWEYAPDPRIPSALVHRAPRDDEVIETVTADWQGVAQVGVPALLADGEAVQLGVGVGVSGT